MRANISGPLTLENLCKRLGSQTGEYQFRCFTLKHVKYLRPMKELRMNELLELLRSPHSFMLYHAIHAISCNCRTDLILVSP